MRCIGAPPECTVEAKARVSARSPYPRVSRAVHPPPFSRRIARCIVPWNGEARAGVAGLSPPCRRVDAHFPCPGKKGWPGQAGGSWREKIRDSTPLAVLSRAEEKSLLLQ